MSVRPRVPYNLLHKPVCTQHNEHGAIQCCPFPNCAKGIEADEITVAMPLTDGEEIYRRTGWVDAQGGISYSWEGDLPLWFSIPRILWREAVRHGVIPPFQQPSAPIYQYTSLSGFLGIIESGEIWLSDYGFLNDTSELQHGLSLARRRFEAAAQQRADAAAVLRAWGSTATEQHRVCVASFSTDADSLSQWRGYGPIAVGFQPGPLAFGYSNTSMMRPVVYDPATQERLLDLLAHLTASAWEHDRRVEPTTVDDLYQDGSDRVLDLVSFFKNDRFSDEREVRLVHTENANTMSRFGIAQPRYRFRVSGKLIVPYLTTKDVAPNHPALLPIREVVVGPGGEAETLRRGIREVLNERGYTDVDVRLSGTPLRN